MDFIRNFPLFSIVLSLFSSVLCMMLSGRKARIYTICYEILLLVMAGAVLWYTWQEGASFTYVMGEFSAPWGNEIRAGVLEALFAIVFLGIMLCSVVACAATGAEPIRSTTAPWDRFPRRTGALPSNSTTPTPCGADSGT